MWGVRTESRKAFLRLAELFLAFALWPRKRSLWAARWEVRGRLPQVFLESNYPSLPGAEQVEYIGEILQLSPRDVVLDAGCGDGSCLAHFAPRIKAGMGVDFASSMIKRAMELHGDVENLFFTVGSVAHLPFSDATFDKTCCYSVLHYLSPSDLGLAVAELLRVTRPGGLLLINVATKRRVFWGMYLGFKDPFLRVLERVGRRFTVTRESPAFLEVLVNV